MKDLWYIAQLMKSAAILQCTLLSRNIQDLTFAIVMPLQTFVTVPFFVFSGRADLVPYALTSSLLFTIGQMGFFVGSEIIAKDRKNEVLQMLVASPAPYSIILMTRTVLICLVGIWGFVESWAITYFIFSIKIEIHHKLVFCVSLLLTAIVSGFTAVLISALFSLAKRVRTLQNAINGPLYLLGGVLVPASYLPSWFQILSPFVFFYWSAELIRGSLSPANIDSLGMKLLCLAGLGGAGLVIGLLVVKRMLKRLRQTGDISLT